MLGDSLRRRRGGRGARRVAAHGRPSRKFWLTWLAIALLVPFAIGYVLTVYVFFPAPDVAPAGIPVPSLYGLTVVEAERALARVGLGSLEITSMPHPVSPEGDVIAQSPLPGQQLRKGASVRVAVSSGPVQVRVPDVLGQPAERAEERLVRLGFKVARVDGASTVDSGRVFEIEPVVGTLAQVPALATIHVSLGGPPDSLAVDSLATPPPDTLRGPR